MSNRQFGTLGILGLFVGCLSFLSTGCQILDDLLPTGSDGTSETNTTTTAGGNGSSPSTPTTNPGVAIEIKAPTIESPASGTKVTLERPVLVVGNTSAQGADKLTYSFELAADEDFVDLIATAFGVPEGDEGSTSWQVPEALSEGRYFWRVRAKAGLAKSPYALADFTVDAPSGGGGGGVTTVYDPLTAGTSVGEVHGGSFTSQGWRVNHKSDYIRYEITPGNNGFVEWENTGLMPSNPDASQFMLMGMWDPTKGDYRANRFRVHIQKLDTRHNKPYIRLRWIANGEQHDNGYNFLGWDPAQTYRWRVEWGPEGSSNLARVLVNGNVIIEQPYSRTYRPDVHWVEMGIAERVESIVGTVYSNVRIGKRD